MNCREVLRGRVLERYLLGQLDGAERDSFEQHFLECDVCFEELEDLRALHDELRRQRDQGPTAAWTRRPTVWAAILACVGVVTFVGWWSLRPSAESERAPGPVAQVEPSPTPAPSPLLDRDALVAELGRIDPPPFRSMVLRRVPSEARRRFRDAMQSYERGDYAAAVPGLRRAAALDPAAPEVVFFLGACYLLTGQAEPAVAQMRATIALGDTPFLEEARFYLAKAYIRVGELAAADAALREVIVLRGELSDEAETLRAKLARLTQPPGGP